MPEQPPTLRDMIRNAVASGMTYAELSQRAVDEVTGKRASHAFLNNIANGKIDRIPQTDHLRAIAAGLGVPYEAVRQAAINEWIPGEPAAEEAERRQQIAELRQLREQADAALARLEGPGRRAS